MPLASQDTECVISKSDTWYRYPPSYMGSFPHSKLQQVENLWKSLEKAVKYTKNLEVLSFYHEKK